MILCSEELFGHDDVVDLFVGEGLDLGLVVIVVQIDAHRLFGEHHRHIELACHYSCNADAAGLDGEHLVDGLAGKQALPLLCHFTEQRNIHLVVDKAVYLEHVALAYNTILADTFFQHLHSEPVPPSLFSISVHSPAHMFFISYSIPDASCFGKSFSCQSSALSALVLFAELSILELV